MLKSKKNLLGTYALSAGYYDEYYGKALQARKEMIDEFAKTFKDVDYLISPTTPHRLSSLVRKQVIH